MHYNNELKLTNPDIVIVESIGDTGININPDTYDPIKYDYRFEDLTPIPLTEEWLIKFGFKEKIPGWFSYESFTIPFKSIVINLKLKSTCIASETDSISMKNIEFVHELQNTFFALTGEELIYAG